MVAAAHLPGAGPSGAHQSPPPGPYRHSGSSRGRLIALRYPNRQLATRLTAAWEEGLAALPLDPALPADAARALLERFRPSQLEDASGRTDLPDGVPVAAGVALVIPTSGSEGDPKGVELTHDALLASARAVVSRLGADAGQRWLCCLPITHIAGLGILVRSALTGIPPVIHDHFDPESIAGETRAKLISLVPAMLLRLLDAGVDLARYSAVMLGGAPAWPGLLERARSMGINLILTYGMTETCGGCIHDGRPLEGVEVRIRRGEQIAIRGPMLMSGYRLEPQATNRVLQGGWFLTSDRGRLEPDGELIILGRRDDVIITGGLKVSPAEVEEILRQHPGVADAAVTGIADEHWGQAVAALIVPAGGRGPDLPELREFVSRYAPRHKAPRHIRVVQDLPRTASGKIQRRALSALLKDSAGSA